MREEPEMEVGGVRLVGKGRRMKKLSIHEHDPDTSLGKD